MANHKSAAKRARQGIRKNAVNSSTKAGVNTFEKKVRALITSGDKENASKTLITFTSRIAKAAKKGLVHKNTLARKISRMSKQIDALKA